MSPMVNSLTPILNEFYLKYGGKFLPTSDKNGTVVDCFQVIIVRKVTFPFSVGCYKYMDDIDL